MTRDTWIVGGALIVALILGVGLYFFAPLIPLQDLGSSFHSQTTPGMKLLVEGTVSNEPDRKNFKIVNQEQFAEIWGMTYGDHAPAIPTIDFSKKQVLAIFAGEKSSGGYAISIKNISDTGDARVVSIVLSEPGKECITTQAITSPFVMVEVNASDLPIQKEETTEMTSCSGN